MLLGFAPLQNIDFCDKSTCERTADCFIGKMSCIMPAVVLMVAFGGDP
ncbi:hypothetical protein CES86_5613 [Brucella lupini]|uniref:Uncharacterized protein n=1 Tax=Brucella lupini TaxID=255457 RepID=A0A256GZY4_9HYPH|nr:hypothetical protein CES86_5613 [Brucella lupini]